jgi:serine/threonine protein kinase
MSQPLSKFGDYFLVKKIATGGMAEIYLARTRTAQGPEKYVALKMIHPRYMEEASFHNMILEEARIAVQLNHPNVGQVFDLGQVDNRYFLVMEFIDGYDLSRLHDATREKSMEIPIDITAFVGREVCNALAYAHALSNAEGTPLNLIHRDISPQNVLIAFDGGVKIIDFGIAKVSTAMQQTQVGVIKGKFYYMSPEQAGAHDVDQRSDLFSLGICLWETLCGKSLFRREGGPTNPLAILHEIRSLPIPRVRDIRPDCPPELDNIVARALSRDLAERWQSATQMSTAMTRFMKNYAPSFSAGQIEGYMERAYEKREITKDSVPVPTHLKDLMDRDGFKPSAHSIIYALPTGQLATPQPMDVHSAATGMLDIQAQQTNIFSVTTGQPLAGVTNSSAPWVDHKEKSTDKAVEQLTNDLAMSNTVFIRKDAVEVMKAAGESPEVVDTTNQEILQEVASDPNQQTQALAESEIQAAQLEYQRKMRESAVVLQPVSRPAVVPTVDDTPAPNPTPPLPPNRTGPLSRHPLFRALVIAVLVLCVLTATLALLLIRRSRTEARLISEQERILKISVPSTDGARTAGW